MTKNQKAFLDMIAVSELGKGLLAVSDDGYNVIVGSTDSHPDLFLSYADHPRKLVKLSATLSSTAAGRYQILMKFYDVYKKQLGLEDFAYYAQGAIALQMVKECHALEDIEAGRFEAAVKKCSSRWASLPGNSYGQHQNTLAMLEEAYTDAGGTLC